MKTHEKHLTVEAKYRILSLMLNLALWCIMFTGPFFQQVFIPEVPGFVRIWSGAIIFSAAVMAYFNVFVLMPKLLFRRKYVIYVFLLVCSFCLVYVLHKILEPPAPPRDAMVGPPGMKHGPHFPFTGVVMIFAMTMGIKLFTHWLVVEYRKQRIAQEQLRTELNFLKNQLSPHFLFNSLNIIYSLTNSNNKKAGEITLKLSRLLRYLVYDTEKEREIDLGTEVTFLNNYIALSKMRLQDNMQVVFNTRIENNQFKIPPLLLLIFVENAFKHGATAQIESTIQFDIFQEGDTFEFNSSNRIIKKGEGLDKLDKAGGVGMANAERRLSLLYNDDQYELKHGFEDGFYKVRFKLIQDED